MQPPWLANYEKGVPHTVEVPPLTLPEVLDAAVAKQPDRTALRCFVDPKLPASTLTYAQLQDRTLRFATALFQLGVRKGDRVAIMLPNGPQYVVAFFGALRLGAVVVNTNPLYVSREMMEQFADSGCETVILLNQFFPRLREIHAATRVRRAIIVDIAETLRFPYRTLVRLVQRRHGELVNVHKQADIFFFRHLLDRYPPTPPGADLRPSDLALLQYTGGTTGTPKAAMLTHGNLVANICQVKGWFATAEVGKEIFLAALPFFHVYGMTTCMLFALNMGAEVVTLPRPRPIDNVLALLQRCRITILPGVPTLYSAINCHPKAREIKLNSVRLCISGAAPLPVEVSKTFENLTGGRLVEGYGLTEAAPVTHANPFLGRRKVGSIGLPLPNVEARIVHLETREELPPGQEGELAVRGPQVMAGYWNRPEETAATLSNGWLYTGDIARMDEDGYFYIVDRKKDMIDVSGFKVIPREVEEVLFMHPKVAEAVVAGVPDAYQGEAVKAYIVLKEGQNSTPQEITEFCRLHLAPFKVPKQVEFRSELPKTMVGKFLRRVLVEEEKNRAEGRGEAQS